MNNPAGTGGSPIDREPEDPMGHVLEPGKGRPGRAAPQGSSI